MTEGDVALRIDGGSPGDTRGGSPRWPAAIIGLAAMNFKNSRREFFGLNVLMVLSGMNVDSHR